MTLVAPGGTFSIGFGYPEVAPLSRLRSGSSRPARRVNGRDERDRWRAVILARRARCR